MMLRDLPMPSSPVAVAAAEVSAAYSSPSLVNHCVRSYLFAASYGDLHGIGYDAELLYVSAMLHDIGLGEEFDNYSLGFEHAGGHVVWVLTAGAGWAPARRTRAAEIIVAHMLDDVSPDDDPEGYLLATATSLDISGRRPEAWPVDLREEVVAHAPRLALVDEFLRCFQDQARRKPTSTAAESIRNGLPDRITHNPLDS